MRFRLLISEAWRSLGANLSTTVAATLTVLVGMFLLGLFIALGSWTVSWSNHVKRELIVKVDFKTKPQATRAQENAVVRLLQANPQVKGWRYVSKEDALKRMKKRYPELTKNLPYNPLPDSLEVTPTKGEYSQALAESLHPLPAGVEKVDSGKKLSSRILQVAHWIEAVFIVATGVLLDRRDAADREHDPALDLLAAARDRGDEARRRDELVRARPVHDRGPALRARRVAARGLLPVLGKELALPAILHHALSSDPDVHALAFPMTALILIGMGLGLGAIGSGLTLRRFLHV